MPDWTRRLQDILMAEGTAVVVTVALTRGSTPRETGAKMIVSPGSIWGTVGGGHLEHEALRLARAALAAGDDGARPALVRFPLAARLGQCCGGVATLALQRFDRSDLEWLQRLRASLAARTATVLVTSLSGPRETPAMFEASSLLEDGHRSPVSTFAHAPVSTFAHAPVSTLAHALLSAETRSPVVETQGGQTWLVEWIAPCAFQVSLFGNGHVGRALATILQTLPCEVRWIDERGPDFPASVAPNIEVIATDLPVDEVGGAPPASFFVVATHSHALDLELVSAILAHGDFSYLGLIGSRSKRAQFERRLAARGVSDAALRRITCPIGAGLRDKHPGAIATATAMELLQVRATLANADPVPIRRAIA